jgi:chemotaxis signal transduction protein
MESYLQLVVGPYLLLLPTIEVFEVKDHRTTPGEEGFTVWRDRILPSVSLRRRLMLPDTDAGVMIVRGHHGLAAEGLVVDRVVGLVRLNDRDLRSIPPGAGASTVYFDKVWTADNSGRQALRLRSFGETVPCGGSAMIH